MADHPGEELFQAALATAKKNLKHDPRVLLDVANFIERHENAIRSIRAPSQEQTVRIASKAARLARPFYSGSRSSALDEAIACAEAPFGGTGGPDVGAAKRAAGSAQVESERAAGLRPGLVRIMIWPIWVVVPVLWMFLAIRTIGPLSGLGPMLVLLSGIAVAAAVVGSVQQLWRFVILPSALSTNPLGVASAYSATAAHLAATATLYSNQGTIFAQRAVEACVQCVAIAEPKRILELLQVLLAELSDATLPVCNREHR